MFTFICRNINNYNCFFYRNPSKVYNLIYYDILHACRDLFWNILHNLSSTDDSDFGRIWRLSIRWSHRIFHYALLSVSSPSGGLSAPGNTRNRNSRISRYTFRVRFSTHPMSFGGPIENISKSGSRPSWPRSSASSCRRSLSRYCSVNPGTCPESSISL